MESIPCIKKKSQSGVALFMVMAAVTMLSLLITEFVYVAQVNQRMAYDGLDHQKALYLAKAGFKISLLRLKAYQQVKALVGGQNSVMQVPRNMLDKIWSFPFLYPLPTNLPGISGIDADKIKEFQNKSALQGNFTANIESGSSRYNINQFLNGFSRTTSSTGTSTSTGSQSGTGTGTSTSTTFDPEASRKAMTEYVTGILDEKFKNDPDFSQEYRDLKIEDLMDGIFAWADRTYERKFNQGREAIKPKKGPFYSINELHMVHPMDDVIFDILAPGFTASITSGINVNTLQEPMLKVLFPTLIEEEVKEFFKYRDDPEEDHFFKSGDEFLKYILDKTNALRHDQKELDRFNEDMKKRQVRFVVDEDTFKITVQAQVNNSIRAIIADVMFIDPDKKPKPNANNPNSPPNPNLPPEAERPGGKINTKAGLKITFMRIL